MVEFGKFVPFTVQVKEKFWPAIIVVLLVVSLGITSTMITGTKEKEYIISYSQYL